MRNFKSFNDKNAGVFPLKLILANSCFLKIDQHEIIFKTNPNIFQPTNFRKGDSWGFFRFSTHISGCFSQI